VKSCDTSPELVVRRLTHKMGYRFCLHRTDLPGKPDLVFPRLRKIIFVHGCFWHGHNCARGARVPVNNRIYWISKITHNRERGKKVISALEALDWMVYVIWECETREELSLNQRLKKVLRSDKRSSRESKGQKGGLNYALKTRARTSRLWSAS
ncbi:MAG: very short patch repair endonuclease, partial [Burkholderiales bacterium]